MKIRYQLTISQSLIFESSGFEVFFVFLLFWWIFSPQKICHSLQLNSIQRCRKKKKKPDRAQISQREPGIEKTSFSDDDMDARSMIGSVKVRSLVSSQSCGGGSERRLRGEVTYRDKESPSKPVIVKALHKPPHLFLRSSPNAMPWMFLRVKE